METIQRVPILSTKLLRAPFVDRFAWRRSRRSQITEQVVDKYWADFLHCNQEQLLTDCETYMTPAPNHFGFWALSRRGGWLVTAPSPLYERAYSEIQAVFLPNVIPNVQQLQTLFCDFAAHELFGPAAILLHKQSARRFPVPAFVRPLTTFDREAVALFKAETPAIVWTLDAPEVWVKVFGAFVQDHLVAACAVRVWGDLLAEIYVDTSPAHQRCGYGRAVTNAALNWIHAETPYLPESVVELTNQASVHLMKSLGFEPYSYMVTCCPAH